jgi:signal transduction histidine kinase
MSLQRVVSGLAGDPAERVSGAITTLDDTIRQIRNTIMSLRNPDEEATLESFVGDIAREAAPLLGFNPKVTLEPPTDELAGPLAADLAACLREGLSNIVRHAQADQVEVHASVDGAALILTLTDDGVGIQSDRRSGLDNISTRVRRYGGRLDITSAPGEGTELRWQVPLPRNPVPQPRRPGRHGS